MDPPPSSHPDTAIYALIDNSSLCRGNSYVFDRTTEALIPIDGNFIFNPIIVINKFAYNLALNSYDNDHTFETPDRYVVPTYCKLTPEVRIVNTGVNNATDFTATLEILDANAREIYSSTRYITSLQTGKDTVIKFNAFFVGDTGIQYTFKAFLDYPLDQYHVDDTLIVCVTSSPQEWLTYDLNVDNCIAAVAGVGGDPTAGEWLRLTFSSTPVKIDQIGITAGADSIQFYFFLDSDSLNKINFEPVDTPIYVTETYNLGHTRYQWGSYTLKQIDVTQDSIVFNTLEAYVSCVFWGGDVGWSGDNLIGLQDNYFRAPYICIFKPLWTR